MDFIGARDLLITTEPFSGMAPEEKGLLLLLAHQYDYEGGDTVYESGDTRAQTFMFLIRGEVEIVDGKGAVVARLGPGSLVGEGAHVVRSHARSMSVRAAKTTSVLYWVAAEVRESDEAMWDFLVEKFQQIVDARRAAH